jgi:hypothetical protein
MGCLAGHKPIFFAYDAKYRSIIQVGIILDAEGARTNRIADISITRTMIERVGCRFDLYPRRARS